MVEDMGNLSRAISEGAEESPNPPRQGLWQNLRAALAYILLTWAMEVMPEPVSTMLARGIVSVQAEIDAYEKQNRETK